MWRKLLVKRVCPVTTCPTEHLSSAAPLVLLSGTCSIKKATGCRKCYCSCTVLARVHNVCMEVYKYERMVGRAFDSGFVCNSCTLQWCMHACKTLSSSVTVCFKKCYRFLSSNKRFISSINLSLLLEKMSPYPCETKICSFFKNCCCCMVIYRAIVICATMFDIWEMCTANVIIRRSLNKI